MKLLVIRNSALGDVTLLYPCFRAMQDLYPSVEIVLLTKTPFHHVFHDLKNVQTITGDYAGKHKGLFGLLALARELGNTCRPDQVLDMHDVLRSRIIRFYFKLKGIPVHVFNKNRGAKADLVRKKRKEALPHVVMLYADVFREAGFDLSSALHSKGDVRKVPQAEKRSIGIAPFARHLLKTWPLSSMKRLMELIDAEYGVHFYLFGGKEDVPLLKELQTVFPSATLVAGNHSLEEELQRMKQMQVFISMDSANMHLADLAGTRVFSIWGATDPLAGFSAWNQPAENSISLAELPCRPCSIYGKGTCYRKDIACLTQLDPERVFLEMKQKGAFT